MSEKRFSDGSAPSANVPQIGKTLIVKDAVTPNSEGKRQNARVQPKTFIATKRRPRLSS